MFPFNLIAFCAVYLLMMPLTLRFLQNFDILNFQRPDRMSCENGLAISEESGKGGKNGFQRQPKGCKSRRVGKGGKVGKSSLGLAKCGETFRPKGLLSLRGPNASRPMPHSRGLCQGLALQSLWTDSAKTRTMQTKLPHPASVRIHFETRCCLLYLSLSDRQTCLFFNCSSPVALFGFVFLDFRHLLHDQLPTSPDPYLHHPNGEKGLPPYPSGVPSCNPETRLHHLED